MLKVCGSTFFFSFLFCYGVVVHHFTRSSVECSQRCRDFALVFQCNACIDFEMHSVWTSKPGFRSFDFVFSLAPYLRDKFQYLDLVAFM